MTDEPIDDTDVIEAAPASLESTGAQAPDVADYETRDPEADDLADPDGDEDTP